MHTGDNVQDKPWAKPAYWEVMLKVFKLFHAEEEIACLHVEIKRLVTYIKEEDAYLWKCQVELWCFNDLYLMCLQQIFALSSFDPMNKLHTEGNREDMEIRHSKALAWRDLSDVEQQQAFLNLAGNNIITALGGEGPTVDEEPDESEGEEDKADAEEAVSHVLGTALVD
ncbi:hypothetical protein Moror_13519 [Moniliophthora roreri MCA 2997]|uniref:Uncharacterized protein n=1 Tax=Moniliophthora roreri (strain MCA 2997) TaxID=1381753 RepID=V2WTF2_MONRO|nr:hypothetical protein Moror_13519 [Moniliophthora roreri MCA 2997]